MESSETNTADLIKELGLEVTKENFALSQLRKEIAKVIIGQEYMVDRLLIALLSNGHVLLEGVPGLAKTLAIKTLSEAIDVGFKRIQFTPDLLPADVTGTMIYSPKNEEFSIKKGPVFTNFILADEINRAPAKVQSALLEAMQERQVTIGDETFDLPEPFLVLATMNPIDQEGTYPLPEAQVDRFMMKVFLDYPSIEEERQIIRANTGELSGEKVELVIKPEDIIKYRQLTRKIYLDEKIEKYIVDLVYASRRPKDFNLEFLAPLIEFGCSPRASINLALAAKAHAFLQNRAFVVPDDVRAVAKDVMCHRIGLSYEAEAEQMSALDIIDKILQNVQVP